VENEGVTWVNDSKATNPHAAAAALGSYLSVIWIAGGLAKGASMDGLVKKMGQRMKHAILIGQDRDLIRAALIEYAPHVAIHDVDNSASAENLMVEVVRKAHAVAMSGDTVLLAPACASMDQFTSYSHRGDVYAQAVRSEISQ
jgi:UDP-N-acetylmuramoylalanine--D-glutamate ligase